MVLFYRNKNQKGETLVEALLALAVATAIATGIVTAVVIALSGTTFDQQTNFAGNYAQEGANLLKDQAAQDFDAMKSEDTGTAGTPYYFGDDQTLNKFDPADFTPCSGSSSTVYNLSDSSYPPNCSYLRTAYINANGCDQRKGTNCLTAADKKCPAGIFIASVVAWNDSKCGKNNLNCHKVEIDACLTDLEVLPTLP